MKTTNTPIDEIKVGADVTAPDQPLPELTPDSKVKLPDAVTPSDTSSVINKEETSLKIIKGDDRKNFLVGLVVIGLVVLVIVIYLML